MCCVVKSFGLLPIWLISARAYPGFYSKVTWSITSPLDWMLIHRRLPPITPGWREASRATCLPQGHRRTNHDDSAEYRTWDHPHWHSCHYTTSLPVVSQLNIVTNMNCDKPLCSSKIHIQVKHASSGWPQDAMLQAALSVLCEFWRRTSNIFC